MLIPVLVLFVSEPVGLNCAYKPTTEEFDRRALHQVTVVLAGFVSELIDDEEVLRRLLAPDK